MKLLKTLLLAMVVLVVLALGAGLFMDAQWQVQRRTAISAPAAEVYAYISHLPSWQQWTAWNTQAYPQMQISYSGPERGVGARQSWDDGAMTGEVEIINAVSGKNFDYVVRMDEGKHEMQCNLAVQPLDSGSEVLWTCSGNSGANPLNRLMMAAYKPMIGKDFDKGLARLQARFAKEQ